MNNGWTEERRRTQAQRIREWQPWQHSTGPRTLEGKARVSRNADKGGTRPTLRRIARWLRQMDSFGG